MSHKHGREKLKKKSGIEQEIATALQAHNQQKHLEGESLPG